MDSSVWEFLLLRRYEKEELYLWNSDQAYFTGHS